MYSSCKDCVDTRRSIGGYISFRQARTVDYGSNVHVPFAISNGESECTSTAVVYMKASHTWIWEYGLKCMETKSYDVKNPISKSSNIIIENEATIAMAECNKDTAGNTHINEMHYSSNIFM